MHIQLPIELAARYKSSAQRARVVSEAWAEENLYCPNCASPRLRRCRANMEAIDFTCPECDSPFQLKSQARPFSGRIVDAAYAAMLRAIRRDRTPSLFALHYDAGRWLVSNLILIPRFAFSLSCVEKRKPLSPTARRANWVGCNIVLVNIPADARISVVREGIPAVVKSVRAQYARLRPLEKIHYEARGWTLDVLNVVRSLDKTEFILSDVYARAEELHHLHPSNRHLEDKIRQQLQRLRDLGFLEFLGRGHYRLQV